MESDEKIKEALSYKKKVAFELERRIKIEQDLRKQIEDLDKSFLSSRPSVLNSNIGGLRIRETQKKEVLAEKRKIETSLAEIQEQIEMAKERMKFADEDLENLGMV